MSRSWAIDWMLAAMVEEGIVGGGGGYECSGGIVINPGTEQAGRRYRFAAEPGVVLCSVSSRAMGNCVVGGGC